MGGSARISAQESATLDQGKSPIRAPPPAFAQSANGGAVYQFCSVDLVFIIEVEVRDHSTDIHPSVDRIAEVDLD